MWASQHACSVSPTGFAAEVHICHLPAVFSISSVDIHDARSPSVLPTELRWASQEAWLCHSRFCGVVAAEI